VLAKDNSWGKKTLTSWIAEKGSWHQLQTTAKRQTEYSQSGLQKEIADFNYRQQPKERENIYRLDYKEFF
jgi:hypothetical protein